MKILVTGATGFIGRALVAYLLAQKKHEVISFVRKSSKRSLIPPGTEVVEGDIFSYNSLKRILERVEVVIHLASEVDFYPDDPQRIFKTNVEGTRNLVRAADDAGVRRFIYISSTEVCAPTPGDELANEETTLSANFDYGESKIMAENEVKEGTKSSLMEYVIIRPTGVIGPGDYVLGGQLFWAVNFGFFFFYPDADGKICFTHVSDIVKGIEMAIENKEVKNDTIILSSNPLSYKEIIRISSKALGRMEPIITLPHPLVRTFVVLVKPIMSKVFPKRFLFEPKTFDQMKYNRIYSHEKATRKLGWKPQYTFESAIQDSISVQLRVGDLKKRSYSMFFVLVTLFIVFISVILIKLL